MTIQTPLTLAELANLKAKAKAATPGPYFAAEDDALDARVHHGSGLALVDTGRESDWPIARLIEWKQARYTEAVPPETILRLIDMVERRDAWQPIETAPKDGTAILVAGGILHFHDDSMFPYEGDAKSVSIARWQKARGCFEGWMGEALEGHDNFIEHRPTKWQPLPIPPSEALAATEPQT